MPNIERPHPYAAGEQVEEGPDGARIETQIPRNVVVIMPFGGSDLVTERRYILEYKRIKYLIENKVNTFSTVVEGRIKYKVRAFRATEGEINRRAFRLIRSADVVVALLTEKNVNVTYELAIRNLLQPEFLMILKGDPSELLPVYLRDMAYIRYERVNDTDSIEIEKQINAMSAASLPDLSWEGDGIPPDFAKILDQRDQRLAQDLESALQRLEAEPPGWPAHLEELVADSLDPASVLTAWTTYTPMSVLRIRWRRQSSADGYQSEDIIGEPVVYAINPAFADLFDFKFEEFPNPSGDTPLTRERLLASIKDYMHDEHMEQMEADQMRLSKRIIFKQRHDQAIVPLQFNDRHPYHPNQAFLPCMIGKRIIGEGRTPHTMYLVVSYTKHFWLLDHPDSPHNAK